LSPGGPFRLALRRLDRIALSIQLDLLRDDIEEIDSSTITEQEQRDRDVRDLMLDRCPMLLASDVLVSIITAHPPKLGEELAGLARDGHGQILRIVELTPVAFSRELAEARLKFGESIWG
jgi:hypothetical protein